MSRAAGWRDCHIFPDLFLINLHVRTVFPCAGLYLVVFNEAAYLLINSARFLLSKSRFERNIILSVFCSLITNGQAMSHFCVWWLNVRSVFGPKNDGQLVETMEEKTC